MIHRYPPTLGHYSSYHDDKDPTTLPKEGLEGTGESDWCEFVAGGCSTRRTIRANTNTTLAADSHHHDNDVTTTTSSD